MIFAPNPLLGFALLAERAPASDRSAIIMPVPPMGAMGKMLLEELGRTREANYRLAATVSSIEKTMIVMGTEHAHVIDEVAKLQAGADAAHADIEKPKARRDRQDGARGQVGWLGSSPISGWLVAAAASAWTILPGRGR